jgi:N-acetylglucosamine-6-sulfatase
MGYKAVRTLRHKYIHYTDLDGMDELYDLKNDPYEMNNVIDDPSLRATLRKLQADVARLAGGRN